MKELAAARERVISPITVFVTVLFFVVAVTVGVALGDTGIEGSALPERLAAAGSLVGELAARVGAVWEGAGR